MPAPRALQPLIDHTHTACLASCSAGAPLQHPSLVHAAASDSPGATSCLYAARTEPHMLACRHRGGSRCHPALQSGAVNGTQWIRHPSTAPVPHDDMCHQGPVVACRHAIQAHADNGQATASLQAAVTRDRGHRLCWRNRPRPPLRFSCVVCCSYRTVRISQHDHAHAAAQTASNATAGHRTATPRRCIARVMVHNSNARVAHSARCQPNSGSPLNVTATTEHLP
jgi:hypothetical protein